LRYDSPVQFTTRIARSGLRVGGVTPPEGAVLLLLLAAAGRDPEVFADPDVFDIARADAHNHLAFASGPHFCLGASLARVEAAIAVGAFVARVANPELGTVKYKPNANLRGPVVLSVGTAGIRGPNADS
jgi:cytochrome P450